MSHLHESNNLRDVLVFEQDEAGQFSREVVTVVSGQNLVQAQVIGKKTKGIATTGTADPGNTGGATVTSVTAGLDTKLGTYTVECTVAASASPVVAAVFKVVDPEGDMIAETGVGAFTNDQINLTITQGSPEAVVGDKWTIAVTAGSGQVTAISLVAVDGTSEAFGFLTEDCDASGGAKEAVAIVKDAVIIAANLVWPAISPAWTTDQKNAALAQLYAKGIVARDQA